MLHGDQRLLREGVVKYRRSAPGILIDNLRSKIPRVQCDPRDVPEWLEARVALVVTGLVWFLRWKRVCEKLWGAIALRQ